MTDVLALLDADAQGWAFARAVREDGAIVDFELLYLNEVGGQILKRTPQEMIGRRYRELWPETVDDGTLALYRQVVERREPLVRTVYYDRLTLTGHFEMWIAPYGDGFAVRFVDLTRLTLNPRSDGGARLYEVLDAAFDGFALLRAVRDERGGIVDFVCEYINQVGAKLAGRTVEDVIDRRLSQISPASIGSGLFDRYREVAETDTPWRRQITDPQTGQVWEIQVANVNLGYVAVSYRDVTEQVQQQELIARSEAHARAAAGQTVVLQTVSAALVAASTPAEVYAALGSALHTSTGAGGIAVLLKQEERLVLRYHTGYERQIVDLLRGQMSRHFAQPATEAASTGQPRFLATPALALGDDTDTAAARSIGRRQAWAFLPLPAAGRVLGVLVIGYAEPRAFDDVEQATLIALAELCAQALQRAMLFEAQRSISEDLQRALLPAALPQLAGARHAVLYLPWTQGADVGGDWYDLIRLDPDAVAMVIGDVAGHSSTAAATMGQLRNALRAYAAEGHSPTGVVERVNRLLTRVEPEAMATCCYLELHLAEGTATAVLAGHPPPVLRAGDGARPLALRAGPPLGVDPEASYLDTSFLLPAGCNLLLYTDGLVEDRRYDIDQGLAELCAAVRSAPTIDPQALVDHILSADVGPYPRSDDVAILSLTVDAEPVVGSLVAERRFRGDAASAPAARRFAGDILAAWGQHGLVDNACLLLGEVITNAVQHTVGDVSVRLTLGDRLHVEVRDRSDRRPDKRTVDADSETGRGLHIVEVLAQAWGFEPLPAGGKVVWFELDPAAAGGSDGARR